MLHLRIRQSPHDAPVLLVALHARMEEAVIRMTAVLILSVRNDGHHAVGWGEVEAEGDVGGFSITVDAVCQVTWR